MAKHTWAWVLAGVGGLYLLGRSQAASAAAAGYGYPANTGLFSGLQSLFGGLAAPNNAGGYQPPDGGFYTGLGNQNYQPVNYSPAQSPTPTQAAATPYTASPGAYTGAGGISPGMLV